MCIRDRCVADELEFSCRPVTLVLMLSSVTLAGDVNSMPLLPWLLLFVMPLVLILAVGSISVLTDCDCRSTLVCRVDTDVGIV